METFSSPVRVTTLPRPPAESLSLPLNLTGWPRIVMVTVPLRDPSDDGSPHTISSSTVNWGPVNRAAKSGAGSVREVLVVEPSTEA
jgi:hypothetical protein